MRRIAIALLLVAGPLRARAGTVVVLPIGFDPGRRPVVEQALTGLGYGDLQFVAAESVVAAVSLVRVEGAPSAEDCASRVRVEEWRGRFEHARGQLQLLAFGSGLAELVALDVELVCLATPPASSDLFRLELGLAEAHTFLAQTAGSDTDKRNFHESEATAALRRAADFGAALSVPADLPPEVLSAYGRVRGQRDDDSPRVVVVGPGARVGARFNGRPLAEGAMDGVRGTNLVQSAAGAEVMASARVRLTSGRTLVWLSEEGPSRQTVEGALRELEASRSGAPVSEESAYLLTGLGRLVGDGGALVYVAEAPAALTVWRPEGDTLLSAAVALARTPLDAWRVALGAGPAVGWTNLGEGPLEGLDDFNLGFAVSGRIAATPWLSVALTVDPWAVTSVIPESQGGGTLFRAVLPARAGLRFGPHARRVALEGGVDVGLHSFGRFGEGDSAVHLASFFASGSVGLSAGFGRQAGVRAQAWFGTGLGYIAGGASVCLEARL